MRNLRCEVQSDSAGKVLVSAVVAGNVAWWNPPLQLSASGRFITSTLRPRRRLWETWRLVDEISARVVGAPFAPNTNPRQR
jgi:hypothetical protein